MKQLVILMVLRPLIVLLEIQIKLKFIGSDMSTRLEVQSAIEELPKSEICDLSKWLQEYLD